MMITGVGTIIIVVVALLLGGDPQQILQIVQQNIPADGGAAAQVDPQDPKQQELKQFVSVVLGSTETVWNDLFRQMGKQYVDPRLVLFSGSVSSACGLTSAAVGPFYCPGDQRVYLDLSFFDEMKQQFNAAGDFAHAYVIAHEVGHHVQKLLGISDMVDAKRSQLSPEEFNRYSVRLELQADFFAGVWAYHANQQEHMLEEGDIEEAINTATAIGDDRLQMQGQGYVVPDSFTHGTSAQRVRWFTRGFKSGNIKDGNTFDVAYEDL